MHISFSQSSVIHKLVRVLTNGCPQIDCSIIIIRLIIRSLYDHESCPAQEVYHYLIVNILPPYRRDDLAMLSCMT